MRNIFAVFYETQSMNILSIGYNRHINKNSMIHAEVDAINKLFYVKKKKYISMLIIRFNKNNDLLISLPCQLCISYMCKLKHNNYILSNIYYSINNNNIEKIKFYNINLIEKHYSCNYYKNH